MPSFRSLLSGFLGSSNPSTRPAKPTKDMYGISYMVLMKGFQLFNPEIFTITPDPSLDNPHLNAVIKVFNACDSLVEDHLTDTANTTVKTLNQCIRDDGAFCIYIEYDNRYDTGKGQETIQWVSFLIGTTEDAETDTPKIEVQTVLTGYLSSGAEHAESYFIPQDIRCLGELDGEPTYFAPETNYNLTGLFAYANEAFIQFMAGLPIDKQTNQKWAQIDDNKILEQAANMCRNMRLRTAQSLDQEVDDLIRQLVIGHAEKIFAPMPPQ